MAPDFLFVTHLDADALETTFVYDPVMKETMLAALASGRPMLVCTAHFGNFENLAAVHNLQGYRITMVVRRLGGGWVGRLWSGGRTRAGLEVLEVTRGETLKAAQRAMRSGRVLGYVIDQNMAAHRAVFPTFFGVPAATAPTPAYLAMRSGALVFFLLDLPLGDGRHQVIIEGPLEPPDTGDRQADVLAFMQDLNDRLERWVRKHPDRWYWLHRRWKTRPPSDGAGRPRRPRAKGAPPVPSAPVPPGTPQIDPGGGAE
jgi:KDO2-lipid IV(A) lauroyltransferase